MSRAGQIYTPWLRERGTGGGGLWYNMSNSELAIKLTEEAVRLS